MNVAIIPARGGSKRIPGKNIKLFAGRPIIAYSIEEAKKTGLFDRIIVSTDSEEIAEIAEETGAEIPFIRPEELADDYSTSISVFAHGLQWLIDNGCEPDHACLIYATAPFLQAASITKGFDIIISQEVSSVFSVTTFASSVFRALQLGELGRLEMLWPEHEMTRSNDLPETYHDAGQFYWVNRRCFMESEQVYTKDAMPVVVPRYLVQDIDTPEDWITAEAMHRVLIEQKKL